MNIFASDACPIKSAKFLDDKRVVKMVLESAQMLSTALHCVGADSPYKPTHKNHPCSIWARNTKKNYIWLYKHFIALLQEYTNRYGKIHKCAEHKQAFINGRKYIPSGELQPHPNCARNKEYNIDYSNLEVHEAYVRYLKARWKTDKRTPTWNKQIINLEEPHEVLE
jgi:hypothetical protein